MKITDLKLYEMREFLKHWTDESNIREVQEAILSHKHVLMSDILYIARGNKDEGIALLIEQALASHLETGNTKLYWMVRNGLTEKIALKALENLSLRTNSQAEDFVHFACQKNYASVALKAVKILVTQKKPSIGNLREILSSVYNSLTREYSSLHGKDVYMETLKASILHKDASQYDLTTAALHLNEESFSIEALDALVMRVQLGSGHEIANMEESLHYLSRVANFAPYETVAVKALHVIVGYKECVRTSTSLSHRATINMSLSFIARNSKYRKVALESLKALVSDGDFHKYGLVDIVEESCDIHNGDIALEALAIIINLPDFEMKDLLRMSGNQNVGRVVRVKSEVDELIMCTQERLSKLSAK